MAAAYGLAPITTPPGDDPHDNQTARILGVSITLMVIPTMAVVLRFLARLLSKAGFWWDDFMVLFALLCSLGLSALQIYSLSVGFGQHMSADGDILTRINTAEYWFKLFYAYEHIYIISTTAAKLSILLFYSRIFKERRFTFWLRVLVAITIMNWLANHLTIIFECLPINALWDPFTTGTCIDIIKFFEATGAANVVIDTAVLLLPLPMIWSLEIERGHKWALSSVFLLGSFVVVAAIVRTVVISKLAIEDITWEFIDAALWTAAEPSVAVTSASLPILRSLWIWNRRKKTDRYGADSPDSYDEPKMAGGPGAARHMPFRKQASLESQKYPLNAMPANAQQVYGNRVTVASNGRSRKLSSEAESHANLPIMQPQEASMAYRPNQQPQLWRSHQPPAYAVYSARTPPATTIPSNRSELYG